MNIMKCFLRLTFSKVRLASAVLIFSIYSFSPILISFSILIPNSAYAQPQDVLKVEDVLINAKTGTIQELGQDDGFIIISGLRLGYANGVTLLTLNGMPMDAADLDVGMVVRYTLDREGTLLRMELLGPNEKIRIFDQH